MFQDQIEQRRHALILRPVEIDLFTVAMDEIELIGALAHVFADDLPQALDILATTDTAGRPSARIVLLKGFDARGFVFYTNYQSRKGLELAANPQAALLFFWPELERQVRIEGLVSPVSAAESDAYYASRPLGSRIGAWASPQSRPITHEALAERVAELSRTLGDDPARPPHWGGYRLEATRIEFWQGRPSRLHDRLVYARDAEGDWALGRIAP